MASNFAKLPGAITGPSFGQRLSALSRGLSHLVLGYRPLRERKPMRIIVATALMILACGIAWAGEPLDFSSEAETIAPTPASGRYRIYQHPQFRGDTFLLDTATGRVWQMVSSGQDSAGKATGLIWEEMSRSGN
jgi:hypothetical protein